MGNFYSESPFSVSLPPSLPPSLTPPLPPSLTGAQKSGPNNEWIDTQAGYVWPVWCGRDYVAKVTTQLLNTPLVVPHPLAV